MANPKFLRTNCVMIAEENGEARYQLAGTLIEESRLLKPA